MAQFLSQGPSLSLGLPSSPSSALSQDASWEELSSTAPSLPPSLPGWDVPIWHDLPTQIPGLQWHPYHSVQHYCLQTLGHVNHVELECVWERACNLSIFLNYKSINLVDNWSPWLVNNSDWCWNVDPFIVHTGMPFSHIGRKYLCIFPCLNVFIQHASLLAHWEVLLEALQLTSPLQIASCFWDPQSGAGPWVLQGSIPGTPHPYFHLPSPLRVTPSPRTRFGGWYSWFWEGSQIQFWHFALLLAPNFLDAISPGCSYPPCLSSAQLLQNPALFWDLLEGEGSLATGPTTSMS